MTDREALFAAVSANPGDATLRLAVLDYLDGSDLPEDEDRAELIRVQTEYGKLTADWHAENFGNLDMYLDPDSSEDQEWKHKVWDLRNRSDALLDAHPAWSELPCAACHGTGYTGQLIRTDPHEFATCRTCYGTGDLLKGYAFTLGSARVRPRRVAWAAGFLYRVECHHSELYERATGDCPSCGGAGYAEFTVGPLGGPEAGGLSKRYVAEPPRKFRRACVRCSNDGAAVGTGKVRTHAPREWARAVAERSPVTHFDVDGLFAREFAVAAEDGCRFVFYRDMTDYVSFTGEAQTVPDQHVVPGAVFGLLGGRVAEHYFVIGEVGARRYARAREAADDLAGAFGAWVRYCPKNKETS